MQPLTDRILARAERLCQIESPTGDYQAGLSIAAELEAQSPSGAEVKLIPSSSPGCGPDVLITLPGSGEGGALLLGHYDTVPRAQGAPLWQLDSNRVLGLGTYDMKVGVAMALELISEWADRRTDFSTLYLLVLADEERREAPPRHRLYPWPGCGGLLSFEGGEPGASFSAVTSRYGAALLSSSVHSRACRAETPADFTSSLSALGDLISCFDHLADRFAPETHLVPTSVEAGEAINVIPEKSLLTSLIRFQDTQSLKDLLCQLPEEQRGCPVEHRVDHLVPALSTSPGSLGLIREAGEVFPGLQVSVRQGSADCCWFSDGFDLIVDGLGPSGGLEHSADEFIDIPSIDSQFRLARFLTERVVNSISGVCRPVLPL